MPSAFSLAVNGEVARGGVDTGVGDVVEPAPHILASSTVRRRPLASMGDASGTTKLDFRYELKRSTLPWILTRYGRRKGTRPLSDLTLRPGAAAAVLRAPAAGGTGRGWAGLDMRQV